MSDQPTRRVVLGCGAACAAAAACGKWVDEPVAIEAGTPVKNTISIPMGRVPELAQKGGSVILHVNASDDSGRRVSVLVANTTSQGYRAYDAYCPHAGCELAWVDKEDSLVCPCHLSKFSVDGIPTHLPAKVPVDSFSAHVSTDQQTLLVDITRIVFPPALNGEVSFDIPQFPVLSQVGASVTGHVPNIDYPIVVLRKDAATMVAFDARCTHLGCAVRGAKSLFVCPCHGSVFDIDGVVKLDPAKGNLRKLQVAFDGSHVTIQVGT